MPHYLSFKLMYNVSRQHPDWIDPKVPRINLSPSRIKVRMFSPFKVDIESVYGRLTTRTGGCFSTALCFLRTRTGYETLKQNRRIYIVGLPALIALGESLSAVKDAICIAATKDVSSSYLLSIVPYSPSTATVEVVCRYRLHCHLGSLPHLPPFLLRLLFSRYPCCEWASCRYCHRFGHGLL